MKKQIFKVINEICCWLRSPVSSDCSESKYCYKQIEHPFLILLKETEDSWEVFFAAAAWTVKKIPPPVFVPAGLKKIKLCGKHSRAGNCASAPAQAAVCLSRLQRGEVK